MLSGKNTAASKPTRELPASRNRREAWPVGPHLHKAKILRRTQYKRAPSAGASVSSGRALELNRRAPQCNGSQGPRGARSASRPSRADTHVTSRPPGRRLRHRDSSSALPTTPWRWTWMETGVSPTGWVLLYYHLADDGMISPWVWLSEGDPLGHPSCQGWPEPSTAWGASRP